MDPRVVKINEYIICSTQIPRNTLYYGKMKETHENNLQQALKCLEKFKNEITEFENKCRVNGITDSDLKNAVYRNFSHMHILYLEQVIAAKKALAMMDIDTVEELTYKKIALLEELALS